MENILSKHGVSLSSRKWSTLDQAEFKIMLFQVKMVIANEVIVLKQFNLMKRMTELNILTLLHQNFLFTGNRLFWLFNLNRETKISKTQQNVDTSKFPSGWQLYFLTTLS